MLSSSVAAEEEDGFESFLILDRKEDARCGYRHVIQYRPSSIPGMKIRKAIAIDRIPVLLSHAVSTFSMLMISRVSGLAMTVFPLMKQVM